MSQEEFLNTKISLAKTILLIESEDLINQVIQLLREEESDFWHTLTEKDKQGILLGLKQAENNELVSFEDVLKKIS